MHGSTLAGTSVTWMQMHAGTTLRCMDLHQFSKVYVHPSDFRGFHGFACILQGYPPRISLDSRGLASILRWVPRRIALEFDGFAFFFARGTPGDVIRFLWIRVHFARGHLLRFHGISIGLRRFCKGVRFGIPSDFHRCAFTLRAP
jgi:hypothetical protein